MSTDARPPLIPTDVIDASMRAVIASFVDRAIVPYAEEWDEDATFPSAVYEQMAGIGLFGITVTQEHGGLGGTARDYLYVMEALSYGYASVADQCGLVELVSTLLSTLGTAEQRERYLDPLLRYQRRCAYALTEPGAGSDLGGVKTHARRTASGWRLDGEKVFIHNAPVADFAVVLAVTSPEASTGRRFSVFLVDIDRPGVHRQYVEHKMGQRASQVGGFVFDGAELPSDALLGEEGAGFGYMMNTLAKGRLGIGGLSLGISRRAITEAAAHAEQRSQFGAPIGRNQAISFRLADMATEYHAGVALAVTAADALESGVDATHLCSMAKLFASEHCVKHASEAVQVFGGTGYIRGSVVERLYRDARITPIYEGTSEMQRLIISRRVLANGIA
jgi:alkylation response protein AidB-like acyl-CoA dehydrogenase